MNKTEPKIAVIGAGAWGTALAVLNARAGKHVTLWARDAAKAAAMRATHENPRLPGIPLPENLIITHEMPEADLLLLAVPMQHLRALSPSLPRNIPVVLCAKGL